MTGTADRSAPETLDPRDILAIHETLARFAWLLDDRHFDLFHLIYTDDVEFDLTYIGGGIVKGIEAFSDLLRTTGVRADHHTINSSIFAEGQDAARARSRYITHFADGKCVNGEYLDVLKRTPVGWRISLRKTVRRLPVLEIGAPPADYYDGWIPTA